MNNDKIAQFSGRKYLNLETYRKNGQGISTPVWFAEQAGVFYIYTLAESYKVKRIRNNPRVRIAPCDARGNLKGEWIDATAAILSDRESRRVHELLNKKYGILKRIADLLAKFRNHHRVEISIIPT